MTELPAKIMHRNSTLARRLRALTITLLVLVAAATSGCAGGQPRVGVLTPDGSPRFPLMDFTQPLDLEALPAGWSHRTFRRHDPMTISFGPKDGRAAIRLATHDTASMLFRQVNVPLDAYPFLDWEWLIEQPIEIPHDELETSGDDHPARLYLSFTSGDGSEHSMEIIWGNQKLRRGDWKHLSFYGLFAFPHYTANGGPENVGRWHAERVDLVDLYRELWGDPGGARLTQLALFCDTDETGAESTAYFSDISVARR